MNETYMYIKALNFAALKHKGQERKGGLPYITHPVAVSELVREYGIDYRLTALFHDLLEDTDASEAEILALSNLQVLNAVRLVTKTKECTMSEYISGIKTNDIAMVVKTADRLHNLKSAVVTDEEFKRRYIADTIKWYWDFSQSIREATAELAATLNEPLNEYPFLYACIK